MARSRNSQSKAPAAVAGLPAEPALTMESVEDVARKAYVFGWALVNAANRAAGAALVAKIANPVREGGMPVAYGRIAMLTGYMSPGERVICCPNQDVVYGAGVFDDLDHHPAVFQVPKFDERPWSYAFYDARTDEFGRIGRAHDTKPGFYLLAGPNWKGPKPAKIIEVVPAPTNLAFAIPRIFVKDTAEDKRKVQTFVRQIDFYQLAEFTGQMKQRNWDDIPRLPPVWLPSQPEIRFVKPRTFFRDLAAVLDTVPPLPGEERLYEDIRRVLAAAATDWRVWRTLQQTAWREEEVTIAPLMTWRLNGVPAGNGWNTSKDSGNWGTNYLQRTATAKSNMFESLPSSTRYFYTDDDGQGRPLNGRNLYTITFPPGQEPPVQAFWSLTVYDEDHFFPENPEERYSLGTKSALKRNDDGSLTLYAGAPAPPAPWRVNWLRAPDLEPFSLYLRAYGPTGGLSGGTWQPPPIVRVLRT